MALTQVMSQMKLSASFVDSMTKIIDEYFLAGAGRCPVPGAEGLQFAGPLRRPIAAEPWFREAQDAAGVMRVARDVIARDEGSRWAGGRMYEGTHPMTGRAITTGPEGGEKACLLGALFLAGGGMDHKHRPYVQQAVNMIAREIARCGVAAQTYNPYMRLPSHAQLVAFVNDNRGRDVALQMLDAAIAAADAGDLAAEDGAYENRAVAYPAAQEATPYGVELSFSSISSGWTSTLYVYDDASVNAETEIVKAIEKPTHTTKPSGKMVKFEGPAMAQGMVAWKAPPAVIHSVWEEAA